MSLFDSLGSSQRQQPAQPKQQITMQQALQQLRADPAGTLRQAGLSIPDGMTGAQQIIQHLLRSGQVPQSRYQQAVRMMQGMQGRRG